MSQNSESFDRKVVAVVYGCLDRYRLGLRRKLPEAGAEASMSSRTPIYVAEVGKSLRQKGR